MLRPTEAQLAARESERLTVLVVIQSALDTLADVLKPLLSSSQLAVSLQQPARLEQLACVLQVTEAANRALIREKATVGVVCQVPGTQQAGTAGLTFTASSNVDRQQGLSVANNQPPTLAFKHIISIYGGFPEEFRELLTLPGSWDVLASTVQGQQLLQAWLSLMLTATKLCQSIYPEEYEAIARAETGAVKLRKQMLPERALTDMLHWINSNLLLELLPSSRSAVPCPLAAPGSNGLSAQQVPQAAAPPGLQLEPCQRPQGQAASTGPSSTHSALPLPHPELLGVVLRQASRLFKACGTFLHQVSQQQASGQAAEVEEGISLIAPFFAESGLMSATGTANGCNVWELSAAVKGLVSILVLLLGTAQAGPQAMLAASRQNSRLHRTQQRGSMAGSVLSGGGTASAMDKQQLADPAGQLLPRVDVRQQEVPEAQLRHILPALVLVLDTLQNTTDPPLADIAYQITEWRQAKARMRLQYSGFCGSLADGMQFLGPCSSSQHPHTAHNRHGSCKRIMASLRRDMSDLEKLERQIKRVSQLPPTQLLDALSSAMLSASDILWAAIPSRYSCNNPTCLSMSGVSESFALLRGKACVCGGCLAMGGSRQPATAAAAAGAQDCMTTAARYCSVECQRAHYAVHSRTCHTQPQAVTGQ